VPHTLSINHNPNRGLRP